MGYKGGRLEVWLTGEEKVDKGGEWEIREGDWGCG